MIVVADTSPLNYLIQIDRIELLLKLYGRVIVPQAVLEELSDTRTPSGVRSWIASPPDWLDVRSCGCQSDSGLAFLDRGERQAIQIALEQQVDLLLIDERRGRIEAKRRGLEITGTLGVLLSAGRQGLTDPLASYRRLAAETTFRTSTALEEEFLTRLGQA